MEMKETKDANTQSKDLFENGAGESNVPDMKNYVFCSNCGTKLIKGVSFCHKCGNKVMQEDAVSETQKLYESQLKYYEDNKVSLSPEQELSMLKQIEDTKTKLENEKKAEEDKSFGQAPSKSSTEMKDQNPNAPAAEIGAEGSWVDNGVKLPFYSKIWFISVVGGVCAMFLSYVALIPVLILEAVRVIKMRTWKHWENRLKDKMVNLVPVLVVVIISILFESVSSIDATNNPNVDSSDVESGEVSDSLASVGGKVETVATVAVDESKYEDFHHITEGQKIVIDNKINRGIRGVDKTYEYYDMGGNTIVHYRDVVNNNLIPNGTYAFIFSRPPYNDMDYYNSKGENPDLWNCAEEHANQYRRLFGVSQDTYVDAGRGWVEGEHNDYTDPDPAFAYIIYMKNSSSLGEYITGCWVRRSDINMHISDSDDFYYYMYLHALLAQVNELNSSFTDKDPIWVGGIVSDINGEYITINETAINPYKNTSDIQWIYTGDVITVINHDKNAYISLGEHISAYGFYNSAKNMIDGYMVHEYGTKVDIPSSYNSSNTSSSGYIPQAATTVGAEPTPAPTAAQSFDEMDDWSSDDTEIGDYVPPEHYASDAEHCCATTYLIVVSSPNSSYANIRSDPSADSSVKYKYENGRTLDYLGDSIQDGDRIWYHVGYYVWSGDNATYDEGWISSKVCEAYI